MRIVIYFHLEKISIKSAEVFVSCAFKETFIKAVTRSQLISAARSQLISAARSLLAKEEAKELRTAEKQKLLVPLALAFLKKKLWELKRDQMYNLLHRTV